MSYINVLSLFDGISCGRLALERAGIQIGKYFASEVDKYATAISKKNFPDIIHLGDVKNIKKTSVPKIHLLIGGSPCQSFSVAGKRNGMTVKEKIDIVTIEQYMELKQKRFDFDGQSYLFWEYVRLLKELQPEYFLLENVRMSKKWQDVISKTLDVEPIKFNSALVSAQNRERLYWTNIPNISTPQDKGMVLKDVLITNDEKFMRINDNNIVFLDKHSSQSGLKCVAGINRVKRWNDKNKQLRRNFSQGERIYSDEGKSPTLSANSGGTAGRGNCLITRPCKLRKYNASSLCHHIADANDIRGNESIKRVYNKTGKSPALTTMQGGHREPKVYIGSFRYRKLIPLECERLQTLPDNYTKKGVFGNGEEKPISNSQRYKVIGNGWTVDIVAHILSFLKNTPG